MFNDLANLKNIKYDPISAIQGAFLWDSNLRACAFVGLYLQHWARMESTLTKTIGQALRLDALQEAILSVNISFREKMNVLKTIIDVEVPPVEEARARHLKTLEKLDNCYNTRNLIAHKRFFPSASISAPTPALAAQGTPDPQSPHPPNSPDSTHRTSKPKTHPKTRQPSRASKSATKGKPSK